MSGFSYYKFSIEIPDDLIIRYNICDLPHEWCDTPSPNSNCDFVMRSFYTPNKYLAMAIPSVMVPEEFNLVINPLHSSFDKVKESILSLGEFTAPKR